MTNKYIPVVCCAVFFVLLAGCRSSKQTVTPGRTETENEKEFFGLLEEQTFRFETLTARLNVGLELPGKRMNSRVDLKMIRDSALQLSVHPFFGIEVFRIEFSRDSIKVLDRINKRYVAENYTALKGQTPVEFNYYNLQDLFTNRLFLPGEQQTGPAQYKRFRREYKEAAGTELQAESLMRLLYTFTADNEGKITSAHISEPAKQYALQWTYDDFRMTADGQLFPMKMDVQLQKQNDRLGGIAISFSRLQTDVPVQLDFVIPSKCKRIGWKQIAKLLIRAKEN